jgi:hypothetical protein
MPATYLETIGGEPGSIQLRLENAREWRQAPACPLLMRDVVGASRRRKSVTRRLCGSGAPISRRPDSCRLANEARERLPTRKRNAKQGELVQPDVCGSDSAS